MGPILLVGVLFLPLLAAIGLLGVSPARVHIHRKVALATACVTFLLSLPLYWILDFSRGDFQLVISSTWIPSLDAGFRIGLDGMSLLLVLLTTFTMPIAIGASIGVITKREKEYYIMMLLLETAMVGVFVALDMFLFYVFWELILIPMYFIIGIWGGQDRIYAAIKFFLYTIVGSLLMLVAIIWLGSYAQTVSGQFTTDFLKLRQLAPEIPLEVQRWLFAAFALSFAIKVPVFPLHTWLPDAHVQAPTAGSVILAGILLKMGTYGLIRFNLDFFPQASIAFAPLLAVLAVIGIIYGALVAMVQPDMKKLVAYSSVSHLGFVVLGIASMTNEGIQGAIIQMVNHGLSTGMLFLCVGILYERRHTREIAEYGGIAAVMPRFAVLFAIAMLASVGLPGLNGFVGEFLTLVGGFRSPYLNSWTYSIVSATGVIFAAVYLLWMFQRVMYGKIVNPANQNLPDLTRQELLTLVPIVVLLIWIGIYPQPFLKASARSTKAIVEKVLHYSVPQKVAFDRMQSPPLLRNR
ncbi:MAG: NADH-quinone oxidoreductase subunit M [Bacteroidota bacterium]|nr:NADH-quinone oxidoreductase subunit M [Candidatus Kapabacteria bacterium]MCS7302152.1 NADH-quinone oxidoreductase subunit M [Candidatus Kapabacteria bacterium]MCX7936419.1 NADH-quinone oxidoreductase subunit M [Chlorobiota bacterium]MDW8074301.1 NADH-quinone oxidoreductase subunit M [Bacteroidota bacterium]MDW8271223.1 NADH-quinone oxidoreductase subunit M [Bacteroidota bacterium]